MYRIIYLSSATTKFTSKEIISLLNASRKRNEVNEITGLLLYSDGNFLQIIEGEKKAILKLYSKISIDSRHKNIIKVFEGIVDSREYPNWRMGFNVIDKKLYKRSINLETFTRDYSENHQDTIASIFIETFLKSSKNKIMIK